MHKFGVCRRLDQDIWLIMGSDTHPFLLSDFRNFRTNSFKVAKSGLKNVSRCSRVSNNLIDKGFH
jgi:hypothetical protein